MGEDMPRIMAEDRGLWLLDYAYHLRKGTAGERTASGKITDRHVECREPLYRKCGHREVCIYKLSHVLRYTAVDLLI